MFQGFVLSSWVFTVPKESPKCMVSSKKKNSTLNCCKLLGWDYLTNFLILRRGHIVKYLLKQGWNYNSAWRQQGRLKILTQSLKLKDWQLTTDDYCTQVFLTVITLQIGETIGCTNLGIISFWPIISSNMLHIVIKSLTYFSDVSLEVQDEIIEGAAVVGFQNKV